MISVALVEDERLTRESLAALISRSSGMRCVAAFASAERAIPAIAKSPPAVALIDLGLPGMSGIECVRQLRSAAPSTKLVVLTKFEDAARIVEALQAGAHGYVLKKSDPAEILNAIAHVHEGGAPMSSEVAARVVQFFHERGRTDPELNSLTARESEVLDLLARGLTNKDISGQLGITPHTVNGYLKGIYEKLHVHSRGEAVAKYLKP
jgi:DNA-binding NarL/FixJ family response regulator